MATPRSTATLTLHRSLDARQAEVQERVLKAARALVRRHGHEAVGMEQVGLAAGVSRATMYRYFSSKEHLVGAVALAWGHELARALPALVRDLEPSAALERIIERVVEEAASDLPMLRATMASVLAVGPVAEQFRRDVRALYRALLEGALPAQGAKKKGARSATPPSLPAALERPLTLLGRVFFADLALLGAGDLTAEECVAELELAARSLLTSSG